MRDPTPQIRELVLYGAQLPDAEQKEYLRTLASVSPEVLAATVGEAARMKESGQLGFITPFQVANAGGSSLGFFDKIGGFLSNGLKQVKNVVAEYGPAAAPFVSMIPGVGEAASGVAAGINSPEAYAANQQRANAIVGQFATAMRAGQVSPKTIAAVRKEEQAKAKVKVLQARLKATRDAAESSAFKLSPLMLAGLGVGALVLLKK
jgi:hypothetical protein